MDFKFGKNPTPIAQVELLKIAETIPPPELKYPKKRDAINWPCIRKKDMQNYLLKLIQLCGGIVFKNDIIFLVKTIYGYKTVTNVSPPSIQEKDGSDSENDYFEDWISAKNCQPDDLYLGQEHYSMAIELHGQLDEPMRDVYYYRRVQGYTTQKTAKILTFSVGKINKIEKDINLCISEYFNPDKYAKKHLSQKNQTTPEEINAVLYLLNHLFMEERMN